MTAGFAMGRGVAVVGPSAAVLVEHLPDEIADELVTQVSDGCQVDDLLDALTSAGLRALGSFAIGVADPEGIRVIVRGGATARVGSPDGWTDADTVSSSDRRTWNEVFAAGASAVALALDEATTDGVRFRVDRGVVPAAVVTMPIEFAPTGSRHEVSAAAESRLLLAAPDDEPGPSPTATERDGGTAIEAVEVPPVAPEPAPVPPALSASDESPVAESAMPVPIVDSTPTIAPGRGTMGRPVADASDDPAVSAVDGKAVQGGDDEATDDQATDYDALYGHTVVRRVQDAAVHGADDADANHTDDADDPDEDRGGAEPSAGDHDGYTMTAGQLAALRRPASEGDHDGLTMTTSQLAQLREHAGEAVPQPAVAGSATVRALMCENGHPNPTHHSACARCGGSLGADPTTIPRPVLGRLELSTGDVIDLDRPVLIGRNPKIEGSRFTEVPRVVKLDEFDGLSRSHAMVRLEGWQVLVVDLGSSNHTTVTLPDRTPRRLHADEPVLISIGSEIDFGGEVTARYVADS